MENSTTKTFREAEEVLSSAINRQITIDEACMMLDKNPDFMSGIAGKIEKAFKAGVLKEKQRDKLIGLYSQYTRIIYNKNKKLKKSEPTNKSASSRLVKGSKPSKSTKATKLKVIDTTQPKVTNNYLTTEDSIHTAVVSLTKQEQEMLEYNADTDEKYEDRSVGEIIRGTDAFVNTHGDTVHKIAGYRYKIFIRDERPLSGDFTREEMDKIYRLYSSMDGAGLTLRAVSREFHLLNYRDFKRILRAFNITKASLPIAPHILEEYSEDEIVSFIHRNKENNVLKKLDLERQKYYEKKYFEILKDNNGSKSHTDWVEQLLESFFSKRKLTNLTTVEKVNVTSKSTKDKASKSSSEYLLNDKPLFCIFGDVHYGKRFESPIFGRGYNKDIAHERIMQIARLTIEEAIKLKTKEIVIVCLGDLVECAMEDGMHPGHSSEMDLFQDDQILFAIDSLQIMLNEFLSKTDCKITYCSIHGNHDRIGIGRDDDKNRTAGKVVTGVLRRLMAKEENIEVIMPKNNLLKLNRGKICLFAQHGDSSLNKKKPSELINLFGEGTSTYHILLKGHWHSLKADEGTNYLTLTAPAVASADKYILEELGNNSLPGFILGYEPNCYGFDYKKITLY